MATKTLTNQELVDLSNGLHMVKDLKGVKFALVVAKNTEMIKKELQHIDDASQPTAEFLGVASQIQALANEEGKEEEIKELEKANEHLTEERVKQLDEIKELLLEEATVNLHTVYSSKLPQDISADQIMKINKIIIEN